jgi:hypothetical protein
MINNVHGQFWGELLSNTLSVDGDTVWTPVLLTVYVNELQKLVAKSMGWTMKPFEPSHPEIVKFTGTLNEVVSGILPAGAGAAAGAAAGKATAQTP